MRKLPKEKNYLPSPKQSQLNLKALIVPAIVGLLVLVAAVLLSYNLGVSQGRDAANRQRDTFYAERITQLAGFGASTPTPNPSASPVPIDAVTPPALPGVSRSDSLFARIEKIEGDKITLQLLGPTGIPTGQVIVLTSGKDILLYQTSATILANLKTGDNVLLAITKDGTTNATQVNKIVVLPTP